VRVKRGLLSAATEGRVLLVLARREQPEPRFALGDTGRRVPPVLGADATLTPGRGCARERVKPFRLRFP